METETDNITTEIDGTIETNSKYKVSVVGWSKRTKGIDDSMLPELYNGKYIVDGDNYYIDSYDSDDVDGNEQNEIEYRNFKSK